MAHEADLVYPLQAVTFDGREARRLLGVSHVPRTVRPATDSTIDPKSRFLARRTERHSTGSGCSGCWICMRGYDMELKVGIIGCGDMGRNHANVWKAREDARIVAVCDILEDRRDKMAGDTGAVAYDNYKEALLHEGLSAISICTPVCFHSEIGCFAAEHGIHVLSEKPMALTLEQADAMIAAAKANGVQLSTSFQYRGMPKYAKWRELFQAGAFGGPVVARFADVREVRPKIAMHKKSMNGGPIIDMAGHYFDLMRFVTGEEPIAVYGRGHVYGRGKQRLAEVDDFAIDAATIEVSMTGGHILSVFVNWGMPEGYAGYGDEIIMGPAMSARPVDGKLELLWADKKKEEIELTGGLPGSTVRINGLVDAIRGVAPLEVSGVDGRIALSVSIAALESIETGAVVKL